MQAEKHDRAWKVSIYTRSNGLRFKLKAEKILPGSNFHRISILLRVRRFVLNLKARSKQTVSSPIQQPKRTKKSRFLRVLEKIRIRPGTKKGPFSAEQPINTQIPDGKFLVNRFKRLVYEDPIRVGYCWVIAIIAVFWLFPRKSTLEAIIQFCGHVFLYRSGD